MRSFTTDFIAEKNKLEGARPWAQLVEITINPSTKAFFTSHPETLTFSGNTWAVLPMQIGAEEQLGDRSLPKLSIGVSNFAGQAFRFAKENDLSTNQVVVYVVNTGLLDAGGAATIKMRILGFAFAKESARFDLGLPFDFNSEGPPQVYNRRDHPSIPFSFINYAVI